MGGGGENAYFQIRLHQVPGVRTEIYLVVGTVQPTTHGLCGRVAKLWGLRSSELDPSPGLATHHLEQAP